MKIKYDHIAWDYNGTISDDVALGIRCVNTLLRRRGLPLVESVERYHEIFGFPIKDYYLRAGFDLSREDYDDVAQEWVIEYRAGEADAPMNVGVRELIERIYNAKIPQTVISMSEKKMLNEGIERYGIRGYFEDICGLDDIYAYSKTDLAIKFANERHPGKVLMIGDTSHDLECATAAGFDCALVACGHESLGHLRDTCGGRCGVYENFGQLERDLFGE